MESILNSVSMRSYSAQSGEKLFVTKIWNILLNIMAVVFICATIIKFRHDQQLTQKTILKKSHLQPHQIPTTNNNKLNYPLSNTYQKAYKRIKLKPQHYNQQLNPKQNGEPSFHIIEPSLYPFTIGTPITQKASSAYHPIITISEELLNSIKQEERNQSKLLHNYFNESEESQILAKHQHEVNQNISLTINLDDVITENQNHENNENQNQNKHNQSVSEQSSFEFQIRNTSNSQDPQIRKHHSSPQQQSSSESGSASDFSHASQSELPDGEDVQVTEKILNQSDQGFGFQSGTKKKPLNTTGASKQQEETQEKKEGYYNVFFTQNPLKKGKAPPPEPNANSPFSWMNQNKKRSRLKW